MLGKGNITDLYSNDPKVAAAARAQNPNTTVLQKQAPIEPAADTGTTPSSAPVKSATTVSTQEVTESKLNLSPQELQELEEIRRYKQEKELAEKEKNLLGWSKEDLAKELLKVRGEAADRRIKTKEVKQERDQIAELYESKFEELSKKIQTFEEKASAYDKLIEEKEKAELKAQEEKLSAEEKLSRRDAALDAFNQQMEAMEKKYQELDKKYQTQLEDERKKLAKLEAKAQVEQSVYKQKVESLLLEVPEEKRQFAETYIKSSENDWKEAYRLMLEAKGANLFGQKTIHISNDTPNRNTVSDTTNETQQKIQSFNPTGMAWVGGQLTPVHTTDVIKHEQRKSSRDKIMRGLQEMKKNNKNRI